MLTLTDSPTNTAAKYLAYGRLVVTATSKKTGDHITLFFRAKNRDRKRYVTLEDATLLGINAGRGSDPVAYMVVRNGQPDLRPNRGADPARIWLAQQLLSYVQTDELHPELELRIEAQCGRCGRPLRDPESVDRGVGPECFNARTSSHHQVKSQNAEIAA